jgi:glutamine amidotransferase
MIGIVDYGMGNVGSVQNMLWRLGHESMTVTTPSGIDRASRLILPGVGAFDSAMTVLRERGLADALDRRVQRDRVPLLGICLGMQLLAEGSEEGVLPGLGWIPGRAQRFRFEPPSPPLPVPHVGWAGTVATRDHLVTRPLPSPPRFYFVHSYHVVCREPGDVLLTADYGAPFCAALARENIVATQFHPEKSHRCGLALLAAFVEWTP